MTKGHSFARGDWSITVTVNLKNDTTFGDLKGGELLAVEVQGADEYYTVTIEALLLSSRASNGEVLLTRHSSDYCCCCNKA